MPKNLQAILDWCRANRPDIVPQIEAGKNNNAFILLLTVGFEAGRQFQADHPDLPLNQPHVYMNR